MAAPCARSFGSVLLKGAAPVPRQCQVVQRRHDATATLCLRSQAARRPPPFPAAGHAPSCMSTKAEPREGEKNAGRGDEGEPRRAPEYIPRRKAKNPMMKVGYAWMIGLPAGILGFVLAKREVDKNRLKQLKVRQRMKSSNEGEYEGSRYRRARGVDLDQ